MPVRPALEEDAAGTSPDWFRPEPNWHLVTITGVIFAPMQAQGWAFH